MEDTKKAAPDIASMNVMQKLALARARFLARNVKKSGKNMQLQFQYFELQDIVPTATRIFANLNLLAIVHFDKNPDPAQPSTANMRVYNADKTDDYIDFSIPYCEVDQIISNTGKVVTNKLQAIGSSITYLRRYLWMLALDVVEQDEVDGTAGMHDSSNPLAPSATPAQTSRKPATPAEREKIKAELTSANVSDENNASPEQLAELKKALNELVKRDESRFEFAQTVSMKTGGFTHMDKNNCIGLTATVKQMIDAYDNKLNKEAVNGME